MRFAYPPYLLTTSMPDSTQKQQRRRGIYLLPNLFTTAALFSGF